MGDLVDLKKDPIYIRKNKLKELLNGKRRKRENEIDGGASASVGADVANQVPVDLNSETLLDALNVLYDECIRVGSGKDSQFKYFVNKFSPIVSELQTLQVNVSDFRIGEVIRRGAFGEIGLGDLHLAKEKSSGGIYAVKVINKFHSSIGKYLRRIDTELSVLSKTNSEWVAGLKYSFQDSRKLYFVIDWISGGNLAQWIEYNDGKVPEEDAKFYLAEIILGLNAIHSAGFAHRNVKPENILLDKIGHIRLADFDCASPLNSQGKVTSALSNIEVGSQRYASPEVLQSLSSDEAEPQELNYGVECDYWSLGVIAYEMIYGTSPFLGETSVGTYKKVVGWKNTLAFPKTPTPSSDYRQLVNELLTDHTSRATYFACVRHSLFNNILWETMRTELPPYIPLTVEEQTLSRSFVHETCGHEAQEPPHGPLPQVNFIGFTKTLLTHGGSWFPGQSQTPMNRSLLSTSFYDNEAAAAESPNTSVVDNGKPSCNHEDELTKLQRDVIAKTALLEEKTSAYQNLETKFAETSKLLSAKEADIASLRSSVKRVKSENDKLERSLHEEKDVRSHCEVSSANLLSQLKQQFKIREADLEADLNYHKSLVSKRDNEICDLEDNIKILQAQLHEVKNELEKSKNSEGEMQKRVSRSYRGSISQMESILHQSTVDTEGKIKELQEKHQEELIAMQHAIKRQYDEQTTVLNEKLFEIEELKGRLEESRSSREDTLEEMKILEKNAEMTIKRLENTIAELTDKVERLEEYHGAKEHEMKELQSMEKKYTAIIQELESTAKQLLEKNEDLGAQIKELTAKLAEFEHMKETNAMNLAVMKEYKEELKEVKLAKKKVEDNFTHELKTKDLVIEEKERKIHNLTVNNDAFKQALEILDAQLNELERVIADQGAQLDDGAKLKLSLESQIQSLKDELKRSKVEVNEAKSLRIFAESKIQDLQSSLDLERSSKESELSNLIKQIEHLTENNNQLSGEVESLLNQIEEFDEKEEHLKGMVEELRSECGAMRDDSNKTLRQMVKIKETNMQLQADLEICRRRNNDYKDRIDTLNEDLTQLEIEKLEDNRKFQEMISQNVKLIEYLQKQVENLTIQMSTPKKKKFGGWFSGRERDREEKENGGSGDHVQRHVPSTPKGK